MSLNKRRSGIAMKIAAFANPFPHRFNSNVDEYSGMEMIFVNF
jgi:hypothetical protein